MAANVFGKLLNCVFMVLLLAGLGACSDKPVSDIKPPAVFKSIQGGSLDEWNAVRSKKVQWAGAVVQVMMIHGDDFIKEYYLRFDPGFNAPAIAEVCIDASAAESYAPGQKVTVTGIILSSEKENQLTIIKLGSGKID